MYSAWHTKGAYACVLQIELVKQLSTIMTTPPSQIKTDRMQ